MKMPGNDTSNSGLYEYEENNYYAESLDNSVMEEFNNRAETDFSEYMWMEHEEEFDKEVNKFNFHLQNKQNANGEFDYQTFQFEHSLNCKS